MPKSKPVFANEHPLTAEQMERWYAAVILCSNTAPDLYYVVLNLPVIWNEQVGTAGTCGNFLYFAPSFFLGLGSDEERAFLIAHEALHVVLRHMARAVGYRMRGFHTMRGDEMIPWDDMTWNIVCDWLINCELQALGMTRLTGSGCYNDDVNRNDLVDDLYVQEMLKRMQQPKPSDNGPQGPEGQPGQPSDDGDESQDQDG